MFPLHDTRSLKKFPLVNLVLIGLNVYVFFQELMTPNLDQFVAKYSLIPDQINFSHFDTLTPFVTSMFLHAGFLHVLSNMWFLWVFGHNIEARIGHLKYFIFYIFSGILASLAQYLFIPDSTLPMLGASGAIAGVLGAYLKFFPRNRIDTIIPIFGLPLILPLPANFMLIYWFFTQAFNGVAAIFTTTISIGGIAYLAHIGGFASGLIFSKYFVWQKPVK